ncbi:SUMF1/EgtB/PvdO family nonheme iron enzyme [Runella sp.]|uniref:formylglycine-generating enzyme family protein n=1 Tax=Runella sp. TaxID=1960881 RepID=UPI00301956E7
MPLYDVFNLLKKFFVLLVAFYPLHNRLSSQTTKPVDSLQIVASFDGYNQKKLMDSLIKVDYDKWAKVRFSDNALIIRYLYLQHCQPPCLFRDSAEWLIASIEFDDALFQYVKESNDPEALKKKYLDMCSVCKFKKIIEGNLQNIINERKPRMVTLKEGSYRMGDTFNRLHKKEENPHRVVLKSFLIGKYEVTFREYDLFCILTNKAKPINEAWGRDLLPVTNVSWLDAIQFCNWRSKIDKLDTVYVFGAFGNVEMEHNANGYRLPTEAEWEYAARDQGQNFLYGNGTNKIYTRLVNFLDSISHGELSERPVGPVSVGSLTSWNSIGLYDFSGNVAEWCWDWYDETYYWYSPQNNPMGPKEGLERVVRGGGFDQGADKCTVFNRNFQIPSAQIKNLGFRLAKNL